MAELSTIIRGKALIEPVLGDTKPLVDSIKTPSLIGDNSVVNPINTISSVNSLPNSNFDAINNTLQQLTANQRQNPESLSNQNQITEDVDDIKNTLDNIKKEGLGDNTVYNPTGNPIPEQEPDKEPKLQPETKTKDDNRNNDNNIVKGVNGVIQAGENSYESALNGNVPNILKNGLSALQTLIGGSLIIEGGKAVISGATAAKNKYRNAEPGMDALLTQFGGLQPNDISSYNFETNQSFANDMRNQVIEKANNTGLKNEEFIQLVNSISGQGLNVSRDEKGNVTGVGSAIDIANKAADYERYTGVDKYQAAEFAARYERFSGNKGDGVKALDFAYNAAKENGLEREQFGEFLSGLERIMEEGISKGFMNVTKDAAVNLAFVSQLAQNTDNKDFFKGEIGVQNYQQMGNAISSATNLQDTGDLFVFRAMSNAFGGSMTDIMKRIEDGTSWSDENFLKELKTMVDTYFIGDKDSQISMYKNIFKTSWNKASEIYDIMQNVEKDENASAKIKETIENTPVKSTVESYTTETQNKQNKFEQEAVNSTKDAALMFDDMQEDLANILKGVQETKGIVKEGFNQVMRLDDIDPENSQEEPLYGESEYNRWSFKDLEREKKYTEEHGAFVKSVYNPNTGETSQIELGFDEDEEELYNLLSEWRFKLPREKLQPIYNTLAEASQNSIAGDRKNGLYAMNPVLLEEATKALKELIEEFRKGLEGQIN